MLGRTLFGDADGIDDDPVAALAGLVPVVGRAFPRGRAAAAAPPAGLADPRNRRFVALRDALHATVERLLGAGRTRTSSRAARPTC